MTSKVAFTFLLAGLLLGCLFLDASPAFAGCPSSASAGSSGAGLFQGGLLSRVKDIVHAIFPKLGTRHSSASFSSVSSAQSSQTFTTVTRTKVVQAAPSAESVSYMMAQAAPVYQYPPPATQTARQERVVYTSHIVAAKSCPNGNCPYTR